MIGSGLLGKEDIGLVYNGVQLAVKPGKLLHANTSILSSRFQRNNS